MDSENYTYENSVTVNAPPAVVFEALTSADRLQG
jgi:uncharacterized protein YndB with AHSA1/START domain